MSTTKTDLADTVARHAPGDASQQAPPDMITPKSTPPYRATYMHLGLPEPTGKPPLRFVKVYPGTQTGTVLLDDDERGVWEYVLHLENQLRALAARVQQCPTDCSEGQSAQVCAEGELPAPSEDATTMQFGGPQARASATNAPETANPSAAAPERALRDSGAQDGELEMPVPNAESVGVSNGSAGVLEGARIEADPHERHDGASLRERVEAVLLKTPSSPNTAIALETACSDEYVRRARKALEAAGTLAPTPVVRSDGTLYLRTTSDNAPEATDTPAQ